MIQRIWTSVGVALVLLMLLLCFLAIRTAAHGASALGDGDMRDGIHRMSDQAAGVVCYYIKSEHGLSGNAYGPALSCVRLTP